MNPTRATLLVLPVAAVLALSACTNAEPGPDETYVPAPSDAADPAPAITPNPIEEDTTLIVRATATASTGAQLSLEMQVHRAVPWDDVAAQTLPKALLEDCAASYTAEQFASEQWSFTRVNVTAIPTDASAGDWPVTNLIDVQPFGTDVPIAGRGDFLAAGDAATPLCQRDRYLTGAARAALSVGVAGDGASFTGWSGHGYGFRVTGAVLEACTAELTPLGSSLGGGSGEWTTKVDGSSCLVGAAGELD